MDKENENKKYKYTCPKCGGHDFSVYNKDSVRNTLLICNDCGNEGSEIALRTKKEVLAQSIADKNKYPSDKASINNDPKKIKLKNIDKTHRKDPKERLMPNDEEDIRSVSMSNPFIKKSIFGFGKNFKDIFEEKTQIPYSTVRKIIFDDIHEYLNKKIIETKTMVPNGPKIHEIMARRVDDIIRKALMMSGINLEISFDEEKKDIFFNNLKQITMENMNEITEGIFPNSPNGDVSLMAKNNPFFKESKINGNINPFFKKSQTDEDTDLYLIHLNDYDDPKELGWFDNIKDAVETAETNNNGNWFSVSSSNNYIEREDAKEIYGWEINFIDKNTDEEYEDYSDEFASKNPFLKEAREYKRSPKGEMAKLDSEKNMTFPEGVQLTKKTKENKEKESEDTKINVMPQNDPHNDMYYDFDTVDRKEYRSSPKARDIIPGQAEWEDTQVDKFYDGWVEDHVENSGGKIIGSNTEKTMNLNKNEHSHAPVYPTESGYERLLENRHEFNDDYTKTYASKKKEVMISESALKTLKTIYAEKLDADCPDCKKKLENKTIEISKLVNPLPKGKERKLVGGEGNQFKLDPVSKEVFYENGHDIGELQPKVNRKKITIKD